MAEPDARQDNAASAQPLSPEDQRGPDSTRAVPLGTVPTAGQKVRDYLLLERIGGGGMGEVYKARHVRLNRLVAIKFVHAFGGDEAVSRFRREMEAIGQLPAHPNLVLATDAGEADGIPYLVMELVEGVNLARLVKQQGCLAIPDACELIRQAACGLEFIADRGMVHRDIKPGNLLLTTSGEVKVLDLGLARCLGAAPADSALTHSGQSMGTPDYMAPEQWEDSRSVDIRADVYSLGCSLYHLLAGQPPFGGSDYSSFPRKMHAHLRVPPPSMQEVRPEVSQALAGIVHRLLAKDPAQRHQRPLEVVHDLQRFCSGNKVGALAREVGGGAFADSKARAPAERLAGTCTYSPKALPTMAGRHQVAAVARKRTLLWCAVAVSALVLLGLLLLPLDRDAPVGSPAAAPKILSMQISHFRGEEVEHLGTIGQSDEPDVRVDDDVRVYAEFDRPAYCFLLALNPDGQVQLCLPRDESSIPDVAEEIQFPQEATSFFGLTDGAGTQAFVLLVSSTPLPSFAEWQSRISDLPWAPFHTQHAWQFDGRTVNPLPVRGPTRGMVRTRVPQSLRETVQFFEKQAAVDTLHAVAFPVVDSVSGVRVLQAGDTQQD